MTKILIATGNAGKCKEMLEVLSVLPIEFVSLADLGFANDAEETGTTYRANALIKAHHFAKRTGLPTIGEDSGIEVAALQNELGVKTRRWGAGEKATDEDWLAVFLERMQSETNRSAAFNCAAAFVDGNDEIVFEGRTKGTLLQEPQCEIPHGIPISALFIPEGKTKVYAAMNPDEKNAISHRGKALYQLKDFLVERFVAE
jgi:XTP/dITP diphosphohydrolase